MISKNKHPTTLYLLNANKSKVQEQRKSARPHFNNKKSSRSISQYQKWNKDASSLFQPSRDSSSIKKLMLNKNQYAAESLDITTRLNSVLDIFKDKKSINKSIQSSLISIKQSSEKKRSTKSRSRTRLKTQSNLNSEIIQFGIQQVLVKTDIKFRQYDKLRQHWRQRYICQETESLLDQVVASFKQMVSEISYHYSQQILGNLQYFQSSLKTTALNYQKEIQTLKSQIEKLQKSANNQMALFSIIKQQHIRGAISSKFTQFLQSKVNFDAEQQFKNNQAYVQMLELGQKLDVFQDLSIQEDNQKMHESQLSKQQDSENDDYVEENSQWNQQFQSKKGIKNVLNYLNDHKNNINKPSINIKIDNWNTITTKPYKQKHKIMSQR